ncbi:MAG TPA: hypothetical protein VGL70_11275 [Candidatus Binatia bacterium]|jgi:hypothetical protein
MQGRSLTDYYRRISQTCEFVLSLPEFFKRRVGVPRAEEEIKRALAHREENFLALARERIYWQPTSPYLKLLKNAGCDYSDIEAHVRRHGLEATLERLAGEGVYLTSEEFKGKQDVARGKISFRVSPADFATPALSPGFTTQSSGTRNRPVPTFVSLAWLAERALVTCLFFHAHGLFSRSHAMYDGILPGAGGVNNLLIYNKLGVAAERWFARVVPGSRNLHHYLTTYLIVLTGKLAGPGFPRPEFIAIRDVRRIVQWIVTRMREGRGCCVTAAASNATRVARAAWDMGASLEGTKFICSGEPLTDAKREIIERVGARGAGRYAYGGSVNIGFGCANPAATDEIHVNEYLLALISHGRFPSEAVRPLLCTTLHPSAPRLLLNVESGDYGVLHRRDCGCALEKAGLTLHLHRIRSFEKFTSEGTNYNYTDLYELVERTLPGEFGGGPGDYQLREEEDENGQTRITIVVHPDIGAVDEGKLVAVLRHALGKNAWHSVLWHDAGTMNVRREIPHASPRGKILPLHILR